MLRSPVPAGDTPRFMKKVFPLQEPGKVDQRVVESVKHEVRKYVKRERRKDLPEGFDRWTFKCKAGPDRATAAACTLDDLGARIDAVASAGGAEVYIEILAEPGLRGGGGDAPATAS